MTILDHGYHLKKVLSLRKEPEIDVMQAVPVKQVVCENIYRAVNSGMARSPVRPAWVAGAGSAGVPGVTSPAIKMAFGGEFPEGEEGGVSPLYIRAHGAKAGSPGTAVNRNMLSRGKRRPGARYI